MRRFNFILVFTLATTPRLHMVAVLAAGAKSERIDLAPALGKLTGTSSAAIPPTVKGVVRLSSPRRKTTQAKFD